MHKILVIFFFIPLLSACQTLQSREPPTTDELISLKQQASAEYEKRNYQEALPLHLELTELISNDPLLYLRTGNIYARLNQPDKAIVNYQSALKLNPQLAIAWHKMGVLQLRQAANTLTQMLQYIKPDDPLYPRAVSLSEATLEVLSGKRD